LRHSLLGGQVVTESALHAREHDLVAIQCLRGAAAVMVVVYHCFPQLERMGYTGRHFTVLSAGVDIFFIISGFIMLYSTARSGRGGGAFLLNRAIRILPLYWLLTAVVTALALLTPQLLQSSRFDLAHVIKSFLMIAARQPVSGRWEPILIPGWTLNYEMYFYVIFALCLWLTRRSLNAMTLVVCAALILIHACSALVEPTSLASFYTDGIILEFVFGILVCRAFLAGARIPARLCLPLIIVGITGFTLFGETAGIPRQYVWGLPALAIFLGTIYLPIKRTTRGVAPFKLIGDASYSLYLSHFMLMSAIGQAWRKLGLDTIPGREPIFILTSVAICTAVAILIYRFVEMPMTEWLKARFRPRSSASRLDPPTLRAPDPWPGRPDALPDTR
jgi:exopolysaccharide production protein ExoZ